jgi:DNA-directed RNA polymerase subunit RPC12/RpoP
VLIETTDGKVVVAKSDSVPMRCPSCRKLFPDESAKHVKVIRCPLCAHRAKVEEFRNVKYHQVCEAKVLVLV